MYKTSCFVHISPKKHTLKSVISAKTRVFFFR